MQNSEARERVLVAAEKLFVERGYEAVTVKDIAKAAGLHHASLYHHIPEGKEHLFIEVMERNIRRHREGIVQAITAGGSSLRDQLRHMAAWLISQPPMDLIRMVNSDMPAIHTAAADHLAYLAYEALLLPFQQVLQQAEARGEIEHPHPGNIAGALFSAIEGLHTLPDIHIKTSRQEMAEEIIDLFIRGLRKA